MTGTERGVRFAASQQSAASNQPQTMNPEHFTSFTTGLGMGLFIHALLWLRGECRHDRAERAAYDKGRKRGYHQCHGEMVAPLERAVEQQLGRKIRWLPAQANVPLQVRAAERMLITHRDGRTRVVVERCEQQVIAMRITHVDGHPYPLVP